MEVTAFGRLESFENPEERQVMEQEFFPSSLDAFVITWKTSLADVTASFQKWVDASFHKRFWRHALVAAVYLANDPDAAFVVDMDTW